MQKIERAHPPSRRGGNPKTTSFEHLEPPQEKEGGGEVKETRGLRQRPVEMITKEPKVKNK